MGLQNVQFDDGIFFAQFLGSIDRADAEQWSAFLREYASTSPTPIVALVEALDASYFSAAARTIIARVSETPNLKAIAIVAPNVLLAIVGMIGIMGGSGRIQVFMSMQEASGFAVAALAETIRVEQSSGSEF
jgi:hypothetical protein